MSDQASQRNVASSVSRQYCLCDKGLDPRKHAEPFVIITRGNAVDTSATRVSPTVKNIHFKLDILPRTRKSVSLNGAAVITKDSNLHPQRASMLGTGPGASSRNCLSPRTIASDARSRERVSVDGARPRLSVGALAQGVGRASADERGRDKKIGAVAAISKRDHRSVSGRACRVGVTPCCIIWAGARNMPFFSDKCDSERAATRSLCLIFVMLAGEHFRTQPGAGHHVFFG
jgi:hypothetical protein